MINDESLRRSTRKRGIDDVDHENNNDRDDCSPMPMTATTGTTIDMTDDSEGKSVDATTGQWQKVNNGNDCERMTPSISVSPQTDATSITTAASISPPGSTPTTNDIVTSTANDADKAAVAEAPTPTISSQTQTPSSSLEQRQQQIPPKSKSFHHLDKKFSPELSYMLVEFRKLELQLLGAPSSTCSSADIQNQQQQPPLKNEAAGSKERREKLHGFILHLEDTMRQIAEGCAMEKHERRKQEQQQQQQPQVSYDEQHQPSINGSNNHDEDQTDVQRLEDHILTNLLPVKVRLTRQLAAQRGASRNPATAPVRPGAAAVGGGGGGGTVGGTASIMSGEGVGVGVAGTSITTIPTTAKEGTFAAAAEAKRKAHERMLFLQAERRRLLEKSGGDSSGPSSFLTSSAGGGGGGGAGSETATVAASASTVRHREGAPSYYGMPIGQVGGSFLTSRLHGRVLGGGGAGAAIGGGGIAPTAAMSSKKASSALTDPSSAAMEASTAAGTADLSTLSTPSAKRRMVLYAGMAPGSTQVSSSINAVAGVHPGLIDEHTAQTVTMVEKERIRLEQLEESAARVAMGMNGEATTNTNAGNDAGGIVGTKVSSSGSQRVVGVDVRESRTQQTSDVEKHSSSIIGLQQWPPSKKSVPQHHYQHKVASADDALSMQSAKQSKPHIPLNFNDPSLDPSQQFELRLQEARWRQRKRRRDRRKKRLVSGAKSPNTGTGYNILQGNFSQQLRPAPAALPPQRFLASNGLHQPGDSPAVNSVGGISSSLGSSVSGMGGGVGVGDISMKSGCSNSRPIEYICAICNEHYPFNCEMNPWWTLSNHDCPKCGKTQIPRLDITAQANAIEYHPALLAHLDEVNTKIETGDSGVAESSLYPPLESNSSANTSSTATSYPMGLHATPYQPTISSQVGMSYATRGPINLAFVAGIARDNPGNSDSDVSGTDESDGEGGSGSLNSGFNYDESSEEEDGKNSGMECDNDDSVAREESVQREEFGYEYKGEKMSDDQARRLLVLIEHASTCPGRHQSAQHRNVCHSTKYLMLHVRDCSGLLPNGDLCPFPWCRKTKHLLYHLVSCEKDFVGSHCSMCSPPESKLSANLVALVGLNKYRRTKFRERIKAVLATRHHFAAAAALAQASSLGKEAELVESGDHLEIPPHLASSSRDPTQMVKFASLNQVPQSHAHFTTVRQQKGGPSPDQISALRKSQLSAFAASQSSTTASSTASASLDSPSDHHLPSPALSVTHTGVSSSLSVMPSLEEAALELGDIALSTSDLIGLSSPSGNEFGSAGNVVLSEPLAATVAAASGDRAPS